MTSEESPEKTIVDIEIDADEEDEKVTFTLGQHTDDEVLQERQRILDESASRNRKKKKKKSRRRSSKFSEDELRMRSFKGSELSHKEFQKLPTDKEEAMLLERKDLDDITHHRFDHLQGLSRHKINKKSSSANLMTIHKDTGTAKALEHQRVLLDSMYLDAKVIDHSPHNVFVEMDELKGDQWVEQSRWIKYEEAREEGSERWGKPHVSSLSFHSLLNLRLSLEKG